MSEYINSLGATARCGGADPTSYKWVDGKCVNTRTGAVYPGDQKLSNCQCLFGSPPSKTKQIFDFLGGQFLQGGLTTSQPGQPTSSFTASGLVLPAVIVVGGVAALLLVAKKKK